MTTEHTVVHHDSVVRVATFDDAGKPVIFYRCRDCDLQGDYVHTFEQYSCPPQ